MSRKQIFIVLPYLKTSESINIYGIEFRSSEDLSSLPDDVCNHFENIFSMFYLKDNYRINKMTYIYFELDESKLEEKITQLLRAQSLIAYFYSAPHPTFLNTFLSKEHANIFLFYPENFSKHLIIPPAELIDNNEVALEKDENISGYKVKINDESTLWVTKNSKIYPPQGQFSLNIPQNLYRDFKMSFTKQKFFTKLIKSQEIYYAVEQRIFTALKWYNRSNSYEMNDETALINLAIAFESLLDLEQGTNITRRFKAAVGLLVGSVPKLDDWLSQFYEARSKIVHEGRIDSSMFKAGDSWYRSLVSYGRRVFQICLGTIISGSNLAMQMDLPFLLQTNKERFETICRTLEKNNFENPKDIILSLEKEIINIKKYIFVGEDNLELRLILGSIKRVLEVYLQAQPAIKGDIKNCIQEFINNYKDGNDYKKLSSLKDIIDHIEKINDEKYGKLFNLVKSLLLSAWNYCFGIFYYLKEKQGS